MSNLEPVMGYKLDETMPLHQLAKRRIRKGRDLKVIITARDSSTGTGKTTLAAWLALQWNQLFTGSEWSADTQATLSAESYLDKYRDLKPGSVLLMDEAEELDARRSMASKNIEFSHEWMIMRTRQVISILTMPTVTALDSRLKELADVRINVLRRGEARVYGIKVMDHSQGRGPQVREPRMHTLTWPDVSEHPEMQRLDAMKQEKIDERVEDRDEEEVDPTEIERNTRKEIAQNMRESGKTLREISNEVEMSEGWVSNNTQKPVSKPDAQTA